MEIDLPGLSFPENVYDSEDTEYEIMFIQLKYLNKYITPDVFFPTLLEHMKRAMRKYNNDTRKRGENMSRTDFIEDYNEEIFKALEYGPTRPGSPYHLKQEYQNFELTKKIERDSLPDAVELMNYVTLIQDLASNDNNMEGRYEIVYRALHDPLTAMGRLWCLEHDDVDIYKLIGISLRNPSIDSDDVLEFMEEQTENSVEFKNKKEREEVVGIVKKAVVNFALGIPQTLSAIGTAVSTLVGDPYITPILVPMIIYPAVQKQLNKVKEEAWNKFSYRIDQDEYLESMTDEELNERSINGLLGPPSDSDEEENSG